MSYVAAAVSMTMTSCCANAITVEQLLAQESKTNTLITFCQSIFILISLNIFQQLRGTPLGVYLPSKSHLVPIILQNVTAYLTNLAFEFNVPMPTHIIIRSTGTVMTMVLGYLFYQKRYTALETLGAILIALGTMVFTLANQKGHLDANILPSSSVDISIGIGIGILLLATLLSSLTSLNKEILFFKRASWVETMYYNYLYGLIIFIPLIPKIQQEYQSFSYENWSILLWNCVTQLSCVAFVNILLVQVSALSLNIILLCRKVASLIMSILLFGNPITFQLLMGGVLVFGGALIYILAVNYKRPIPLKQD